MSLSETLSLRAGEIGKVTSETLIKMEVWDKTLSNASDEMTRQALEAAETIDSRTQAMKEVSGEAATLVNELKERTEQVGVADFLRRATFITERLQSLAVDMARLLETHISEDDWRRFNKGEKGIFVRKMLGFKEKSRLAAIQQKYQADGEFREYVDRYLSQFDSFLKEAKKRDHLEVLSTTFLSSDMGKVYMLLARALGREI